MPLHNSTPTLWWSHAIFRRNWSPYYIMTCSGISCDDPFYPTRQSSVYIRRINIVGLFRSAIDHRGMLMIVRKAAPPPTYHNNKRHHQFRYLLWIHHRSYIKITNHIYPPSGVFISITSLSSRRQIHRIALNVRLYILLCIQNITIIIIMIRCQCHHRHITTFYGDIGNIRQSRSRSS